MFEEPLASAIQSFFHAILVPLVRGVIVVLGEKEQLKTLFSLLRPFRLGFVFLELKLLLRGDPLRFL